MRRVVILLRKTNDAQRKFFESLDYNLEVSDTRVVFVEFDVGTTPEEWISRGHDLYEEKQYKMAASCFNAAKVSQFLFLGLIRVIHVKQKKLIFSISHLQIILVGI